jgi:hypothetical protein
MTRLALRSAIFRNILIVVCCALTVLFVQTPVGLAQHGGGHVGGGHVGGGVGGVHAAPPPAVHGASAPRHFTPAPPIGHFGPVPGTGALLRYRGPIRPLPPPVYPFYGYPFFFGGPFFYGFGPGWGFNSCWWWANCDLNWLWGYGFNSWSPYGYGYGGYDGTPGNYIAAAPSTPSYAYPLTYGGGREDLPQLYLKDGTVYTVTDYWVVDEQLHFTMREEGKMVEHTIPFEELDLQRTIDTAKQRGFLFVLRDEPLQQYMKDHPELDKTPENE